MPKVLLTDCWTRKTLSAVRSLGREGITIDVTSHTRIAPAIYSDHANQYFIVPDPQKYPQRYLEKIIAIIKTGEYDCVIPFEESSIEIFLGARTQIEQYTTLPIASAQAYHIANNKWEVLKLAQQLNVPMPLSFRPEDDTQITEALSQLSYPFIMKPVSSSGSRGIKKIHNREQFNQEYPLTVAKYGNPILQEYIDMAGEGCGVGALAKGGEVLANFSYKRLREFPVNGGPSTLRQSTHDEETKVYAAKLLKAINWDGVAMVEFKRDIKTGQPKLMEINPRFWGSLDLAFSAGVNFPYLLYLQSQNRFIEQPNYNLDVMSRWLLPGDVAHFVANPQRFSLKPSFFTFIDKDLYYDDFKKDDIKGSIAAVLCTIAMVFDPAVWRIGIFRK